MATSYSGFLFADITQLNLTLRYLRLFTSKDFQPCEPSALLSETLAVNVEIPLGTEKAKSEMLVTPVLLELWRRNKEVFAFFSGYTFDVDKEQGLTGRCDYILSNAAESPVIEAPIIAIVEAKNDNIDEAIPQCAAQMLASKIFNEQKGKPLPLIYGATTTGYEWRFMRLHGSTLEIDKEIYQLRALPELLGVLQHVVDFYKNVPEAA